MWMWMLLFQNKLKANDLYQQIYWYKGVFIYYSKGKQKVYEYMWRIRPALCQQYLILMYDHTSWDSHGICYSGILF